MNTAIELLNGWGGRLPGLAWAMFWQSSVLGLAILALDLALRRRLRASVRYGLWLVLLVKLVLPPSLALPTSPAWWWHPAVSPVTAPAQPVTDPQTTVVYENAASVEPPPELASVPEVIPPPALNPAARVLLALAMVSAGLLLWLLVRWAQVIRTGRAATEELSFAPLLQETCELASIRPHVRVKITRQTMSPAVCGLFRPIILLPQSLTETLSPEQLRAVLLHELMHLRRGDVWVNFAQALLQIVYWWHPLVWLANARIRRVREEAVDDAVVVALQEQAEIYAPTLLAVAKFAFQRPLASLGLIGILESRSALRQRIERLVNQPVPRKAGLGMVSVLGILTFSAVALPMGDAPAPAPEPAAPPADRTVTPTTKLNLPVPDRSGMYLKVKVFQLSAAGLVNLYKETGLTAKSSENDCLHAISKLLGVERPLPGGGTALPATSLWLGDQGLLVVRGKPGELEAVDGLISGLNEVPYHGPNFRVETPDWQISAELAAGTNLVTRTFQLNTNVFFASLRQALGQNLSGDTAGGRELIPALFDRFQVDMQPPQAYYNGRRGELFVKAAAADMDAIEAVVGALDQVPPSALSDDEPEGIQAAKRLFEQGKLDPAEMKFSEVLAAHPGDATAQYYIQRIRQVRLATTQSVNTGLGRHDIVLRLRGILLEHVDYDGPLNEVLSNLSAQLRELDPLKVGVNFLINPNPPDAPGATINPATGLPADEASGAADISSAHIKLKLSGVRADQLLDAIVMVADQPVRYSIQDFGVVFYAQPRGEPAYTRTFKVDPDTFVQGLEGVGSTTFGASAVSGGAAAGGGSGNNSGAVIPVVNVAPGEEQLRGGTGGGSAGAQSQSMKPFSVPRPDLELNDHLLDVMRRLGVNVSPPNTVFFNRQKGTLFVKASRADLQKIERALAAMSKAPPPSGSGTGDSESGNISVDSQTTEVASSPSSKSLGFDWYAGQFGAPHPGGASNAGPTGETIAGASANPHFPEVSHAREVSTARLSDRYFPVIRTNFLATLAAAIGTNRPADRPPAWLLVDYFRFIGVEWGGLDVVDYTANNGTLHVRAPRSELKIIENALSALKVLESFPQFHLKSYFIEVGGSIENVDAALKGAMIASYIDTTNKVEIGIMSSTNARSFRHKLQGFSGAITLAEPEVTLSNHRQVQMRSTVVKTIVFGLKPEPDGTVADAGADRFVTTNMEFGPIFEAIPAVMGDDFTVELKAQARMKEFDGYQPAVNPTELQPFVPVFTVREMNANLRLYDGQSLVMIDRQPRLAPADTVPKGAMSDLSARPGTARTLLIVMTTVSLVDAAGNLIHSDHELPFAADHIPPQDFGPIHGPYLDDRPFKQELGF